MSLYALPDPEPTPAEDTGATAQWLDMQTTALAGVSVDGAILVTWSDSTGPTVNWCGMPSFQGAAYVVHDVGLAIENGDSPTDAARAAWELLVRRQVLVQERAAEKARLFPWSCESCPRRYKTQRGAEAHEQREHGQPSSHHVG